MQRAELIAKLDRPASDPWDFIIIGGGAVGAGAALDAVSRGYSCVLLEQHDFGKGTSSRSTKLIHGGVRYLAQGNVSLVREALYERGLLLQNAPSLVRPLKFVIPCYSAGERWYYWGGMKCYDLLARNSNYRRSEAMSSSALREAISTIVDDRLAGGVAYYDAQFDDAGLLIAVLQQVAQRNGVPLNYTRVDELVITDNRVAGVRAVDQETGRTFVLSARAVINATGPFSDAVRQMESRDAPQMIAHSQGIHVVVEPRFLGGEHALMIPKTEDGRVLFAIPWLGKVILGTTDTPVPGADLEPNAQQQEIDYLLAHFAAYLNPAPTRADILSVFAGLRPLVKPQRNGGSTAQISREHRVLISEQGLISVLGGKWTTFRRMGEQAIDVAERVAGLDQRRSRTESIRLDESVSSGLRPDAGSEPRELIGEACDHQFARTVEDVLARRSRMLFLDARNSIEIAGDVAKSLGQKLGKDSAWIEAQTNGFRELASGYLPT